jgi:hypothetical protein
MYHRAPTGYQGFVRFCFCFMTLKSREGVGIAALVKYILLLVVVSQLLHFH